MEQEQATNQEYPRSSQMNEEKPRPNKAGPRQLEEQLLECKHILEAALEMANMGVWKLLFDTNEVHCSTRGKAHLGYSADVTLTYEMLDQRMISAADGTGRTITGQGKIIQDMVERLQKQQAYQIEYQVRWPDDSIHCIESNGKVLTNKSGKVIGIAGITCDITEQKQEQQRKDAYSSKVRHELKTPLTTIKGFTQLLRRRMKRLELEEQSKMLMRIEEQVDILNTLINEMKNAPKAQSKGREGFTFCAEQPFSLLSKPEPSDNSGGGETKNDR